MIASRSHPFEKREAQMKISGGAFQERPSKPCKDGIPEIAMHRRHHAWQDFPAEAIAHQDKPPVCCGDSVLKCAAVPALLLGNDTRAKVSSSLLRSVAIAGVGDDHFAAYAGLHFAGTHPGVRRGYYDSARLGFPMEVLMAPSAESDQILGRVIAQSAPRLNVVDL